MCALRMPLKLKCIWRMQAFDIASEENPSFVGESSPLHLSEASCTPVVLMHRR